MPNVSVIVPVFNDAERLEQCLDALAVQTLPQDQFEVIVVDNGSKEPPRELVARYPFCRFAEESEPGSYAARNRGLKLVTGDVIAFTDADCWPDVGWLEAGFDAVTSAGKPVVVSGPIRIYARDEAAPNSAELYDMAFGLDQQEHMKMGYFPTANLFVRRSAFTEVGPFETGVMSGGDAKWSRAAVEQGYELRFVESAAIRHPARASVSELMRQARRFAGGRFDLKQRRNIFSLHYWRVAARMVLPNIPKMFRARRALRKLGFRGLTWMRTIPVILAVQYSRTLEFVRKRLGLRSERQ